MFDLFLTYVFFFSLFQVFFMTLAFPVDFLFDSLF